MKFLTFLFFIAFLMPGRIGIQAQSCAGNLGANIFLNGSFGAGVPNVLQQDPGIAPGYLYTTRVPPPDGYYTITNNTGLWTNNFGAWLGIKDNSPDIHGYMMVVNADYTPGIFYEQVVTGLCENTLYEFSADIINIVRAATGGHIKPNVSFLLDDVVLFNTGDIGQTERWQTYAFTFITNPGQFSMKLSLRNNAPGGSGNDLALDNIQFRPCGPAAFILPETVANICEDGQPVTLEATIQSDAYDNVAIQWQRSSDNGLTWQDIPGETSPQFVHSNLRGGNYYYRFLVANGPMNLQNSKCRIRSNEKIIRVIPKEYVRQDTLCKGLRYLVGDSEYSESGVYVDSMINFLGCDSIIISELEFVPNPDFQLETLLQAPSCSGFQDGKIEILQVTQGNPPFQFKWGELPYSFSGILDALPGNTTFNLQLLDRFGCLDSFSFTLNDPPPLILQLPDYQVFNLGETANIFPVSSFEITDFEWKSSLPVPPCPGTPPCLNLSWPASQSQILLLEAKDENGCLVKDSTIVEVRSERPVYIPNAFSPNGDGINDNFTIFAFSPAVSKVSSLKVFDRWGNLVAHRKNFPPNHSEEGWDGRYAGKLLNPGVYVYLAEIEFIDGQVVKFAGDLLLSQ